MRNSLKLGGKGSAHLFSKTTWKKEKKPKKEKPLKTRCDEKWAYLVKLRAGFKSELSGEAGKQIGGEIILGSHHIYGKSNYRLRYDLSGGICINNYSEHIWGVHNKNNPSLANEYYNKILAYIGKERKEYLDGLLHFKGKTDLKLVEIYLDNEIKRHN